MGNSRPLSFCTVAYSFYDLDTRVRRYAEAAHKQGFLAHAIALRKEGAPHQKTLDGVTVFQIQKRSYNERGRWVYLLRIIMFMLQGGFLLTRLFIKHRYRIIHIHNVPDFLVFMAIVPKLFGARIILDIHDILPEFYCQKFDKPFDSRFARALMLTERLSIGFSDYCIVANDLWRRKIVARNNIAPDRCTALLNYPQTELFLKQDNVAVKHRCEIIYPGHLSKHHGIDIGVRAMAVVIKRIPFARLHIYASSYEAEYKASLEKLVSELGLERVVLFHDTLLLEKLVEVYRCMTMGIVTKRTGIFSSEAFSTKIFDYFAAGLPAVVSRTQIDELYFDGSLLRYFKPDDAGDLAEQIIDLHLHAEDRKAMSLAMARFIAENSWTRQSSRYLDILNSLAPEISKIT
jgi:glycosyltransferase involved in cell wall biosynthesis